MFDVQVTFCYVIHLKTQNQILLKQVEQRQGRRQYRSIKTEFCNHSCL